MPTRVTGTVKWFNNSKGYGFITLADGREAFVHHNQIKMEGYRSLKRGQIVTFELVDEEAGLKALAVHFEQKVVETTPEISKPDVSPAGAGYRRNQIVKLEEDREHEFKSLQKAKDPVRTITEYYVEEYVNAFLNTNGGVIYFGIADDGSAQGIELDRGQRDLLRTQISSIINKFQPPVEPDLYSLNFVALENETEIYIVEIHVAKGKSALYMTGSQNFYLRRDGSNFLMPFEMIRNRLGPSSAEEAGDDRSETMPDAEIPNKIEPDGQASAEIDLGILLSMVFMSWSDDKLTEEDVNLIEQRARDEGLDEQEVNLLMRATVQPPLLETIVSYLPTLESRRAAATVAYLSAVHEHKITDKERRSFEQMCDALGLPDDERGKIRDLAEKTM